jgi:hypothetical protein
VSLSSRPAGSKARRPAATPTSSSAAAPGPRRPTPPWLHTSSKGSTSAGVIGGTGTLTIAGSQTYANPVNETVQVTISHIYGYTTTATTTATATP